MENIPDEWGAALAALIAETRRRVLGHPRSSLLGVLAFTGGMAAIGTQFGYEWGRTPNGKSGAELVAAVTALLTGLLWKGSGSGKGNGGC